MVEVSNNSTRQSSFCGAYISATMSHNFETKPKDEHVSILRLIKFSKKSTKPSEH